MKKKETSFPKLTLTTYLKWPVGLCSARLKFRKKKKIYSPFNLFLTLQFIIGYFFVAFIFYSFYKKAKLKFSIGYDFFQEGAHILNMFRDAG